MIHRILLCSFFLASLNCASGLQAQNQTQSGTTSTQNSPARLRLTVEQAIELGMKSSHVLHSSEVKIRAAEARVGESAAAILPSLALVAGYNRLSDIPADRQFRFQLDASSLFNVANVSPALLADPSVQRAFQAIGQATAPTPVPEGTVPPPAFPIILDNYSVQANIVYPVFSGFRLEAAKAAAEYNAQAATADLSRDRLETEFNIRNAYWSLYKAQQLRKLTDESIAQVETRLKEAQNMFKGGMLTTNDVLRLQLQLSNTKISRIDAENAVRLSMLSLNNLLSLPLGTEIELASTTEYKPAQAPEYEQAIARSLEVRPDVNATLLRIKAGEENIRAARGGYLPTLSLVGNALYANPNNRFVGRRAEWNASWAVGAQVSWSVWNWNTTGYQVVQAEAQVAQAEDALIMQKDGIKLEVTQNYLSLQQAREKVAVSQQGVEQADENYRIINQKFKNGAALTSDLTDAVTLQLQTKVSYTTAVVDYEIARARLLKSIGDGEIITGK
jgi:outer membrane protein